MSEVDMGRAVWAGVSVAAEVADPEKGRPVGVLVPGQMDAALLEVILEVAEIALYNVREERNLAAAKLLFELAEKLKKGVEVPAEDYESLAEKLWEAHREQAEDGQPKQ